MPGAKKKVGSIRRTNRNVVPGLGAAVKARRESLGRSLTEVAEAVGTTASSLHGIEGGTRAASLRLAALLARELGLSLDRLAGVADD